MTALTREAADIHRTTGMPTRRWYQVLFGILTITLTSVASAQALERVRLGLPSLVAVEHSEFLFGGGLGFFAEEGLELNLVGFQGSTLVIPQLINKSVEFGLTASGPLILGLDQNKPLPLRFVYNWYRATLSDFAVLADSSVKSLADLKGKKLGIYDFSAPTIPMTQAALKKHGIEWQKDIEVLPVGVGPAAWKQLETGRVDALNLAAVDDVKMITSGMKIRRIPYPDNLRTIFGIALLAHVDTIRDRPDLVRRVGRAMAKSTIACAAAREACVRSLWKFDPTSRPAADKEAEWVRNAVTLLEATFASQSYFPDQKASWGSFPSNVFDSYLEAMKGAGLISRSDLPRELLYTNEFSSSFNDFDPAEVKQRAREQATNQSRQSK
jgi:NitT/TauT family transport system substrate-binding protein